MGGTNKKHMVKYEVDVSEGLQVWAEWSSSFARMQS